MNMPGFTAEVTLYSSVTPYRSHCFIHTEVGLNVTPQLGFTSEIITDFIGEWMARLSSEAAFFGGMNTGGSSPADIAERKYCAGLKDRCRRGNREACQLHADQCG